LDLLIEIKSFVRSTNRVEVLATSNGLLRLTEGA